ncbi:hypothetical protein OAH97_02025 [Octadecabacter sp.]|nr:hypothetical protein [Octadecabacter sp.]
MRFSLAVIGGLVAACPAFSQSLPVTFEGASLTGAYNDYNGFEGAGGSDDGFTYTINAAARISFGQNFGALFTLGYNEEEFDGDFFSSRAFVDINPYHKVLDGEIGPFFTYFQRNQGSFEGVQYGVSGKQQYGKYTFEGYASVFEDSLSPITTNPVGVAFGYDVAHGFSVYVGQRRDVLNGGDYEALSTIAASFDLSTIDTVEVPIIIGAEYSVFHDEDTSLTSSDFDQFSLVATYNFGGGAQPTFFRGIRSVDFFFD